MPNELLTEEEREIELLETLCHNLLTQDNAITSHPIFIVQEKRRVYGFDTDYSDEAVWVDEEGIELSTADAELAEQRYELGDEGNPDTWTRTAYKDFWEFKTACFTRQGCEDYIAANRSHLFEPRIYVESGYRNHEWQLLRKVLPSLLASRKAEKELRAEYDLLMKQFNKTFAALSSLALRPPAYMSLVKQFAEQERQAVMAMDKGGHYA